MEELVKLLEESISKNLEKIILSNGRDKEKLQKIKIRPVMIQGKMFFQETAYIGTQVFHKNYQEEEMKKQCLKYFIEDFRQGEMETISYRAIVLIGKKGTVTIKKKKKDTLDAVSNEIPTHNRTKKYILEEGKAVDFLVGLGVQTKEGKIVKSKYDKFRQINRYLEFVEDVYEDLPKERKVRIIDFGCGKSYLTFALYYYLHELKKRQVSILGLDLKSTVIDHCNKLAREYGYEDLHFEKGNIRDYQGDEKPDMVVSLHACDTATDYALEKAVHWDAKVILAVPCCQHEVNKQIQYKELEPIFKYGIIKERVSALLTDALRANFLEQCGYDTQILEFIDMEHTPKNLLIRAVKGKSMRSIKSVERERESLIGLVQKMHLKPTLQTLLEDRV